MAGIRTVGVIGAGQMGSGIAHVVALGGYEVLLHDVSPDRIAASRELIGRNMTRQVSREIITPQEMEAAQARILPAPEL
ncbi:3-hydroxyacyl-CoA dehydrogenase NAD-binding domain-containing protein, partial [Phenylobacterium sp.]|uniref:3-hydroxyacyl-CoA dehydrogenase NAD-binding domain-containing protein n=1 Tax=Phenylobacterium sp. TaxID=1871053 RepID=UPI0025EF135B